MGGPETPATKGVACERDVEARQARSLAYPVLPDLPTTVPYRVRQHLQKRVTLLVVCPFTADVIAAASAVSSQVGKNQ